MTVALLPVVDSILSGPIPGDVYACDMPAVKAATGCTLGEGGTLDDDDDA